MTTHGVPENKAKITLEDIWTEGDHKKHLKPIGDPMSLFRILTSHRIKIAVCTTDNRAGTEAVLSELDLHQFIDILICGDDPDAIPKPSPHNALRICKELNVDPRKTVMVGDTKTDIKMSKSANLGLTVGVLSGVGKMEDLSPGADHIIENIDCLLPLIFPRGFENLNQMPQQNRWAKSSIVSNTNLIKKRNYSTFSPFPFHGHFSSVTTKKHFSTKSDTQVYDYIIS